MIELSLEVTASWRMVIASLSKTLSSMPSVGQVGTTRIDDEVSWSFPLLHLKTHSLSDETALGWFRAKSTYCSGVVEVFEELRSSNTVAVELRIETNQQET